MGGLVRFVGPLLLVAGIALVADSIVTGAAHLTLLVVIPVVTGSSATFLGGAVLVVLGVAFLPFTFVTPGAPLAEPAPPGVGPAERPAESGGLILVGPLPIFFGRWRGASAARYWLAVALGAALLTVALVLLFVL